MAKLIYRFGYVFWLLGLLLPLLYLFAIAQLKAVIQLIRKDRWAQWIFGFAIFQVLVIAFNIQFEYATTDRIVAAFHNVAAFGFILIGMAVVAHQDARKWLERYAKEIALAMALVVLVGSAYSWGTATELEYKGLLAHFIENKFTLVKHNRLEVSHWYSLPRTYAFHVYSNGTGMLLFSVFLLCIYTGWDKLKKWQLFSLHALLAVLMFCTGSRMFLLFGLAMWLISFLRHFSQIAKFRKWIAPVAVLGGSLAVMLFFFRGGSNSTRLMIYEVSLRFWLENAMLTGVGVKPILLEHNYPMGSHSTLVGYLFRFGFVGGFAVLIVYGKLLAKTAVVLWKQVNDKLLFEPKVIYLLLGCAMLLISTLLEDIDSYEYSAFYLGALGFYLRETFLKHQTEA